MNDCRQERRFNLNLYTYLQVEGVCGEVRSAVATTRDISCSGAYLHIDSPFPVGTRASLQICLRPTHERDLTPARIAGLRVMGTVLRCEPGGMTVRFEGDFDFLEAH